MNLNPKISFVLAARNDDYAGNFLNRVTTSLKVLIYLANKFKSNFELIVVEYNPPKDKERLSVALKIKNNTHLPVRFITIPTEFHESISKGFKNPLFEYIAKNIGIRRARGEYILTMNPDIIFEEKLIEFLSQDSLNKHNFYRINRHDISTSTFDEKMEIPEILDECRKKETRVWVMNGLKYVSYKQWLKRFFRKPKPKNLIVCPLFNFRLKIKDLFNPKAIHQNAAGDFCLAHRDAWHAVRGFYQEPFNFYMDGYNAFMFDCKGFEQKILPFPIYHINHGWGNNVRSVSMFNESTKETSPDLPSTIIETKEYIRTVKEMFRTKIPYKENVVDWGFPDINFEEETVTV